MKKMMTIVLCAALLWTSGNMELYAASEVVEENVQAIEMTLKETEEVAATGVSLTEKSVTAKVGCTAADLQELLNLNADGQYKLTVNIPAGTYKLTKSLYVYPNTTIKANANAKLIKQSKYGAMIEVKLINDDGGYDANHDITIDGGIWDSEPLMNSRDGGTETFRFIHSNNIIIKNATLRNVPEGSHLIVFAGVQNATVTNCKFYGYGDDGDGKITPKEAVQLDTTHSEIQVPTNQADQITWDDLPCDKITISDCEFYDFSRGIGSHTAVAGRIHSNITIKNNKFHDLSDSAIRLYNYKDTVVTSNTIKNAEEGILVYTYIEDAEADSYFNPLNGKVGKLPADYNITISKNTITNIKDADNIWGDGVRVIGKSNRPMAGVKISGNTITNMSRYGIFATTAPNLTIGTGNKITTTVNHAILLEQGSSDSNIYGNVISGAKNSGIAVYGSENVTINSNQVASVNTAIYLLDAVKCTVGKSGKGNTVASSKENGITLSTDPVQKKGTGCTSTKVQYNTVKSAKTNGIFVYKTQKANINKNTIVAAGESGILVTTGSTSAKVANNTINAAKENGISITLASKYAQITGNKVLKYGIANKDGKRYGIMIYQSGGSSKTNTKVLKNSIMGTGTAKKKNGIQISSSSYTTVSGNTVTKPDGVGIYGYKSKYCTIGMSKSDYNTVKNSSEQGIYLTTTCDGSKVLYNKVSGAKADGIGAYASKKITISKNIVSAKESGIYITTKCSSSKITNNTVSSAGNHGIGVATNCKSVAITGNTVEKYSTSKKDGNGIYVYKSGGASSKNRTKVTKNTITGTGKSSSKNGIKVSEAAYTTIESNTVTSAAGAGVYVYKSKSCIINKNKVKSPQTLGITVTTNCDGAKVSSNTISKAGDTSINLYKAPKSTVSSNTITTTKKYRGIWVSTSNKTSITSNKVTGAKKSEAILVTSSFSCKKSKNKIK